MWRRLWRLFNPIDHKRRALLEYYSEEYLDKLRREHQLVTAAYNLLRTQFFQYKNVHGDIVVPKAIEELAVERLILEAKIDSIVEFLND